MESTPVRPVALNSEAATSSIATLISPALPSPMATSQRWKRMIRRRPASSLATTRSLVSAECR
jgi:hypothetical protein